MTGADGAISAEAGRPAGKPPRRWLVIVLVVVPCLLTLAVAAYGVLFSLITGISACFTDPPGTVPGEALAVLGPPQHRTLAVALLRQDAGGGNPCTNYQGWFQSPAGTDTILAAELILGLAAFVILIAGLLVPGRRRALGIAGWIVLLLACAGVGLIFWNP